MQLQQHAKVLIVEAEQDKCLVYSLVQAEQDRAFIQLILQFYKSFILLVACSHGDGGNREIRKITFS